MSISFRTNSDGSNGAIQLNGTDRIVMTSSGNVTFKNSGTTTFEGTVEWPASPAFTGTPTAPTATAGTNTTQIATTAFAKAEAAAVASALSLPAGSLIYYAGSVAPAGYLEANGAWLSRTTYAKLFAAIGIIYNAGDGSTTFGLPDLRGEFIRGWDHGRGLDAGRLIGSWQNHEISSHQHGTPYWSVTADNGSGLVVMQAGTGRVALTSNTGGNETRPRNVSALICIKY